MSPATSIAADTPVSGPPPHFIGIGAQKAGTTWLYAMLKLHPQVGFPLRGAYLGKEVHFWSVRRKRGMKWYRSIFGDEPKTGEISPEYATLPRARIAEIRRYNPDMRLFYFLRNPIERAWSSENMRIRIRRRKSENRGEAVADAPPGDEHFKTALSTPRAAQHGDYAGNLTKWSGIFPSESILAVRYERILEAPREVLADCARHIGIDPGFFDTLPDAMLREQAGIPNPNAGALSRELYGYLATLHHDHILSLEALLGWDLSAWKVDYDEWVARKSRAGRRGLSSAGT
jgi:hypothetical protein